MVAPNETVFHLSPRAAFRVVRSDAAEICIGRTVLTVSLDVHRVAAEFAYPRTIAEVHARFAVDAARADIDEIIAALQSHGVIAPLAARDEAVESLASVLHPVTFRDPALLERVGRLVGEGRAVAIADAFDPAFADRVHAALERSKGWLPYQHGGQPFFYFQHHNLYEEVRFSPELHECKRIFDGGPTKELVGRLTGRDCRGRAEFGASLYLPGDYSLPHTDATHLRSIAYVWHLTRDWAPEWGGHLVWCPTGAILSPSFNTLVVFQVTERSLHFVAPVSPYARGRRLAVNGWWCRGTPSLMAPSTPSYSWSLPLSPGRYGDGTHPLGDDERVLVL